MSCTECYNGCSQIQSDKCIKYTGADVSFLDVENGDSLLSVEQKIITYLQSLSGGTGISFNMGVVCNAIQQYLPTPQNINLKDIVNALIQAVCEMNQKLLDLEDVVEGITEPYSIGCLENSPTNVHSIIQETINKVCETASDLASFKISVKSNYVKLSDLNTLIQEYLDTH